MAAAAWRTALARIWNAILLFMFMRCLLVTGQMCGKHDDLGSECQDQEGDLVSLLQASGQKFDINVVERSVTRSTAILAHGVTKRQASSKSVPTPQNGSSNATDASTIALSLYQLSGSTVSRLRDIPAIVFILPVVAMCLIIICFYVLGILCMDDGHRGEDPKGRWIKSPQRVVMDRFQQTGTGVPVSASMMSPEIGAYRRSPEVSSHSQVNMPQMQAMMSPAAQFVGGTLTPNIPKVCQSLVMDNAESRFGVDMKDLARFVVGQSVDIISTSRKPLLCVSCPSDGRLEISCQPRGSMPRCSVVLPAHDGGMGEVKGANSEPYANFRLVPNYSGKVDIEIVHSGRVITKVEEAGGFRYSITTAQGQHLAIAKKNASDYVAGVEYFEMRCAPGTDAILIIAIVLTHAIFYASS